MLPIAQSDDGYFGLPSLGKVIVNAIESVLKRISNALVGVLEAILEGLKELVIAAPYPQRSGGEPAFFEPQNVSNGSGGALNLWGELFSTGVYNDVVLPTALAIFVMAFAIGYFGKLFEEFPGMEGYTPSMTRVFFLFLLSITWLTVMTGVLAFSDGVAQFMVEVGTSSGSNGADFSLNSDNSSGVSDFAVSLAQLVLALGSVFTTIGGLVFWAIRYVLLYQLGVFMPVLLAFKAFDEVELPFISTIGDTGWDLWFFAAFANLPSALIFLFFGTIGSFVSAIQDGALSGLLGSLFVVIIRVSLPVIALYAPILFLKFGNTSGAIGRVSTKVSGTAGAVGGAAAGAAGATVASALDKDDDSSSLATGAVEASNRLADSDNSLVSSAASKTQRAAATTQQATRAARGKELADYSDKNDTALAKASGMDDSTLVDEDGRRTGVAGAAIGQKSRNVGRWAANKAPGEAGKDMDELVDAEDEKVAEAERADIDAGGFNGFMSELSGATGNEETAALEALERGYDGEYQNQLEVLDKANSGQLRLGRDEISKVNKEVDEFTEEGIQDKKKELLNRDDLSINERQLDAVARTVSNRGGVAEARQRANERYGEQIDSGTISSIMNNTRINTVEGLSEANVDDVTDEMAIEKDQAKIAIDVAREQRIADNLGIDQNNAQLNDAMTEVVDNLDIENSAQLRDLSKSFETYSEAGQELNNSVMDAIGDIEQETIEEADNLQELKNEVEAGKMAGVASDLKNMGVSGGEEQLEVVKDVKVSQKVETEIETNSDISANDVARLSEAANRGVGDEVVAAAAGTAGTGGDTVSGQSLDQVTEAADMNREDALKASETGKAVRRAMDSAGVNDADNFGAAKDALYMAVRQNDSKQDFINDVSQNYSGNLTPEDVEKLGQIADSVYGSGDGGNDDTPDVNF